MYYLQTFSESISNVNLSESFCTERNRDIFIWVLVRVAAAAAAAAAGTQARCSSLALHRTQLACQPEWPAAGRTAGA